MSDTDLLENVFSAFPGKFRQSIFSVVECANPKYLFHLVSYTLRLQTYRQPERYNEVNIFCIGS